MTKNFSFKGKAYYEQIKNANSLLTVRTCYWKWKPEYYWEAGILNFPSILTGAPPPPEKRKNKNTCKNLTRVFDVAMNTS